LGHYIPQIRIIGATITSVIEKAESKSDDSLTDAITIAKKFRNEWNKTFEDILESPLLKLATLLTPTAACKLSAATFEAYWKAVVDVMAPTRDEVPPAASASASSGDCSGMDEIDLSYLSSSDDDSTEAAPAGGAASAATSEGGAAGAPVAGHKRKAPSSAAKGSAKKANCGAGSADDEVEASGASLGIEALAGSVEELLSKERVHLLKALTALKQRMAAAKAAEAKAKAEGDTDFKPVFFSDLEELAALHAAGLTPLICERALQILPIQPTQTSSERIFSRAAIVTKDRARLKPEYIEKFVLSYKNCRTLTAAYPGLYATPEEESSAKLEDTAADDMDESAAFGVEPVDDSEPTGSAAAGGAGAGVPMAGAEESKAADA